MVVSRSCTTGYSCGDHARPHDTKPHLGPSLARAAGAVRAPFPLIWQNFVHTRSIELTCIVLLLPKKERK